MNKFHLVHVPAEAGNIFINNVGCIRYTVGAMSTTIEPTESGVFFEPNRHEIIGDSIVDEKRYLVIQDKHRVDVKEIIKQELTTNYQHYVTVGRLKQHIVMFNIPDTAKIMIERVEDRYYNHNNWGVYFKRGDHTIKDQYGNIIPSTLTQYTPAWSCVKYSDDNDLLFIDLHY